VLADLSKDAHKCPECKTELFYFREKTGKSELPGFEGWLPKHIGPYQVRAFVAQGGMGIVLRGLHKENDMLAAVKLLKGDPDHDPIWKSRFEAEITTLTSLKHPNVVRLQAHGRDDKLLWLAMDWIDGEPLTNWIGKVRGDKNLIPLDQIRSAMAQIISGLQYLHGRQIIHRDLKPSNILVAQDDLVKMVDFGIARTSGGNTAVATRLTQTGMVSGTESYMAPEQAEGRDVTAASDVYSLGVIWYELLTGRRPMGTFISPESIRSETPAAWSRGISQCLAMEARSRPSLEEISRMLSGTAPPPIPVIAPVVVAPPPVPVAMSGYVAASASGYAAAGVATSTGPGRAAPGSGFGGILKGILGGLARGAAAAGAGIAAFLRKHPPKEWVEKLGPIGKAIRKNPKIWVGGGVLAGIILVILLIRGLSDNSTPAAPAANPAAPVAAVPAAAAAGAVAPAEQQKVPAEATPPVNPPVQQAADPEPGAYNAACNAMRRCVWEAQFLAINNPNVSITPEGDGSFLVRAMCQGYYPGRGFGAAPFQCTVHLAPDGSWTADQPQY
jgi:serine/threonine-protein kinase